MKNYSTIEFWFACTLCAAVLAEIYPMFWIGNYTFASHSHDAALLWIEFIMSSLFFLVTVNCVFWEWSLLLMRRSSPAASATAPAGVFCGGLISVLLNIILFSLYG